MSAASTADPSGENPPVLPNAIDRPPVDANPARRSTAKEPTRQTRGLYAREWRPAGRPRGAFLLLHGMESHSRWFSELASRLVGDGWAVVAYDRSGWGNSTGVRGHLAGYRDFVEEASLMAHSVREKYGAVHLAGMSWGGMAALYLALRRPWLFTSLSLLAPGLSAKKDLPFAGKYRIFADWIRGDLNGKVSPKFAPEHFTDDPEWRDFVDQDPDRVRSVSTSFCLETLKMRRFIRETAGRRRLPPSLCVLAGADAIINNRVARKVCRKAGVEVKTIHRAAHTLVFEQAGRTAAFLSDHAGEAAGHSLRDGTVWVVGAGAVGGAVAARLAFAGRKVGVLVKASQLDILRRKGITLRAGNAVRDTGRSLTFADTPAGLPPNPALVVLAVKSFDTDAALAGLAGNLPSGTVLASLQNGLGNEDKMAAAFPDHTIVAASVCASLEMTSPGEIVWADDRGGVAAALHRGDREIAQKTWEDNFGSTGMECRWQEGVNAGQRLKWSKLMLNIGFNALNSVTGLPSAALLRDNVYGVLALQALREGFTIMRTLSLDPVDLPGFPVSKLALLLKAPLFLARKLMAWQAGRTQEAAFSMRQDMLQKRQHTEIQEINGIIVSIGRRFNIECSANQKLVGMVENFPKD